MTEKSTKELDFRNWTKEGTTVYTRYFRINQDFIHEMRTTTSDEVARRMEHNARLIVAAPRMFELCLKVIDKVTDFDELVPIAEEIILLVCDKNTYDNIDDPKWTEARPMHDWRNYVTIRVRQLWNTFTHEQKVALHEQATDLADQEEYE